jgi:hypothetical protein
MFATVANICRCNQRGNVSSGWKLCDSASGARRRRRNLQKGGAGGAVPKVLLFDQSRRAFRFSERRNVILVETFAH